MNICNLQNRTGASIMNLIQDRSIGAVRQESQSGELLYE